MSKRTRASMEPTTAAGEQDGSTHVGTTSPAAAASSTSSSRITFKPPTAAAGSSALQSSAAVNPLRRTRSLGTPNTDSMQDVGENDQEERKAESEKPSRKKAKMGDSPSLAPSTRSPQMIVSIPGDMSDDDDFFTSMDPNAADLKPVSGRVAASTFFKALDEHKEAARSARDASSSGAAAAAFVDDKFASLSFADPPLDWNIHGKIRFTSTESFAWIEEHDGEQESNGLHAYITHSPSSTHPCSCLDDASFLRELHHALQYSTFPHSPFTKNHPLTGPFQLAVAKAQELHSHADKLALQYVTKVWIQWEDSFRSLYYRLRLPPHSPSYVDYFYTVHRSPYAFTVLFLAADEDSKASAITALVSRSNKVFRTALQKAGVQYTMPNSTRGERADAAAAAAAASVLGANPQEMDDATIQARLQQQKEDKLEKDEDMTAASVLLIQGRERVHCLYDFLLHQDRRELNVPTLLASTVFLNSTLQSLNIVRVGAQTKMAAGGTGTLQRQESLTKSASMFGAFSPMAGQGGGANALVKEYALDITGPILPASAVRMFSLLARTQKSNFTAHLSSDYPGMNLNCVEKAVQMDALRNQPSLGLCTQKALRTSTVTYLHGKQPVSCIGALRRVKCEVAENGASRFLVDLNTNPVS